MPIHDYIKKVFEEVPDSSYIIRFMDYLISKHFKRTTFIVQGVLAEPMITGVIKNLKTKERYYSLAQFYTKVTGKYIEETNLELLKLINITNNYSLWRFICGISEEEILEFFDQKYRSFLIFRDVRKRVKFYTSIDTNSDIHLFWNDKEYILNYTKIECKDKSNPYLHYEFMEAYEEGFIKDLYYSKDNTKYLITDS